MTEVKTNKYVAWLTENWFMVFFFVVFSLIIGSLVSNIINHRTSVREVSTQNAGCIYLETSSLGDGQHYMICDGQVVLKRLVDEYGVEATTEEKLEEVVPTAPTK